MPLNYVLFSGVLIYDHKLMSLKFLRILQDLNSKKEWKDKFGFYEVYKRIGKLGQLVESS